MEQQEVHEKHVFNEMEKQEIYEKQAPQNIDLGKNGSICPVGKCLRDSDIDKCNIHGVVMRDVRTRISKMQQLFFELMSKSPHELIVPNTQYVHQIQAHERVVEVPPVIRGFAADFGVQGGGHDHEQYHDEYHGEYHGHDDSGDFDHDRDYDDFEHDRDEDHGLSSSEEEVEEVPVAVGYTDPYLHRWIRRMVNGVSIVGCVEDIGIVKTSHEML